MNAEENVPEHVQRVREMDGDALQAECEAIHNLKAVEPERELPESFRDGFKKSDS